VDKPYGHILPRELRWLNIPEPFRSEIRSYVIREKRIELHKYFHHLNSSQAFALSLFYPYLTHAKRDLASALGVAPIERWSFEEIPDPDEGTNVDVFLAAEGDAPIYCEVKLSETGFGKARPDERHRKKVDSIYRPRLAGKVDPALLISEAFCASYQILRNLWLAADEPRALVVFLMPKENEVLSSELDQVLRLVSSDIKARSRVVYVEDVLKRLEASAPSRNNLSWYATMLREKYVPKAVV
jgi:hypothetical protein